jgi:flagellar biogenesis protein FliO
MLSLLDAAQQRSDWSGLLQALSALALLSAGAYVVLRAAAQRGWGAAAKGALQIEQRIALDQHSALVVLQVEGRRLLLAVHRHAAARLLIELEARREPGAASPGRPRERGGP